jgi:hypothetical protein
LRSAFAVMLSGNSKGFAVSGIFCYYISI